MKKKIIITSAKLKKLQACNEEGYDWFVSQDVTSLKPLCLKLVEENRANWANWLIVRCMTKKQKVQYAIYAAEQVIEIYEKEYPNDSRPRDAIKAAKAYLKSPTKKNKNATTAAHAAHAAYAAEKKAMQVKILKYTFKLLGI